MTFRVSIIAVLVLMTACRSPKETVTKTLTAADYPYIEHFHEGVRLKVKGQCAEALKMFELCHAEKPQDDAVVFAMAQCYLILNQRQQAAIFTEKAVKLDPNNIWYTQELGYMYYEQGKFEEAAACFRKMIAKEPKNVDWLFSYADILKRLDRKQEAISTYNKMEDELGVIPEISLQKFDLYISLKEDEKALEELNKARKTYPDDISILGTLVDYYFQKRDVQKAKTILTELVAANPANGRANLALADLIWREGDKAEAYKYFKAAFEGEGVDVDTKMNVLLTFYEQQAKTDPEVLELAAIMVDRHPEDAKSWSIQGDLLLKNDEKEKALVSYQQALKLDDTKFAIWNQVLMLHYEQRNFEDLYRQARACSALFPTIASVQLLYTIACVQTHRYNEAIDGADMGKELVINDPVMEGEFYAQRGEASFWLKEIPTGIENFEKAMQLDPTNLLTKSNYALLLALNNTQPEKAVKLINEVLEKAPDRPLFLDTKGMIYLISENYEEASSLFERAHQLAPKDRTIIEHLGDISALTGNLVKAVEYWQQAKALGSQNKVLDKKIQNKAYYAPQF